MYSIVSGTQYLVRVSIYNDTAYVLWISIYNNNNSSTGASTHAPPPYPFVSASKPPQTSPPDSGFFHWYRHFRKRRNLNRLGQRAQSELDAASLTARYAAIRERQLATGLPPQHHLKKRDRSGPSKFHHAAVKKFQK